MIKRALWYEYESKTRWKHRGNLLHSPATSALNCFFGRVTNSWHSSIIPWQTFINLPIIAWFGTVSRADKNRLHRTVNVAVLIIDVTWPSAVFLKRFQVSSSSCARRRLGWWSAVMVMAHSKNVWVYVGFSFVHICIICHVSCLMGFIFKPVFCVGPARQIYFTGSKWEQTTLHLSYCFPVVLLSPPLVEAKK